MRPRTIILPILLLTVSLLLMFQGRRAAQAKPEKGQTVAGAGPIIFSGAKDTEGVFRMEPIVVINGGKYHEPPVNVAPGVARKFTDTYFRAGRQYRMLFGGGDAGSLTVRKFEPDSCGNLIAEVDAQTTARVGGEVQALAVASDEIRAGV